MATETEERLKKLAWFKQNKIETYAYQFDQKHHADTIVNNFNRYENQEVKVAGRLMAIRGHGKIGFGDLVDGSGKIQLFVAVDNLSARDFEIWEHLDRGDIIGVEGTVFKSQKGEITVRAKKVQLLSKCVNALPDTWFGVKDQEIKYRQRYLDLIINPESRKVFQLRSKITLFIREFLDSRGFIDVETPLLQPIYGGAAANPFKTHCNALDKDLFLSIAPELYLKRYSVGGFERVYEITKKFRNEGIDKFHNPEHTSVEWYQCYADYNEGMDLVEELFKFLSKKLFNRTTFYCQGKKIDFAKKWRRIPILEAIKEHTGVDINDIFTDEDAKEVARDHDIDEATVTRANIADELLKTFRQKLIQPVFLTDYPIELCPLAKPNRNNPKLAEIFQPFAGGMELARAYSELNDPEIQAKHFEEQEEERTKGNTEAMETDKDFVNALRFGMPPCCGVGIGIERLVMFFANQPTIRDVMAFPIMRYQE